MSQENAIVLSPRSRLAQEMGDDAIAVVLQTDQRDIKDKGGKSLLYHVQRDIKRKGMKNNMVMCADDATMPYVVHVTFDPEASKANPDNILVRAGRFDVPDPETGRMMRVRGRTFILVDGLSGLLPYIGVEPFVDKSGEKKIAYTANSHPCFVFRPFGKEAKMDDPQYFVVPLGIAQPDRVEKWNNIANQKRLYARSDAEKAMLDQQWPIITLMPHAHTSKDKRYLIFTPEFMQYMNTANDQGDTNDADGQEEDKKGTDSPLYFGYFFGQRVIDASDGKILPPVPAEGQPDLFFIPQVFEIKKMTRNALYVTYRGPADKVNIQKGALKFDKIVVDGFRALGLTVYTADKDSVQRTASRLVGGKLDESNPLFVYVTESKGYEEGSTMFTIRQALQRYAKMAVDSVNTELDNAFNDLHGRLTTAVLPTWEELLAGRDIADVWYRESGEDDVAALYLAPYFDSSFDWTSWLCMKVREDLLSLVASRNGVSKPARPSAQTEVSESVTGSQPTSEPENISEPQATVATEAKDVKEDVPTKPKRMRKKPEDSSANSPA